jgi:hypothetical protein
VSVGDATHERARRRRIHEPAIVAVALAPSGEDRHTHCALINDKGHGTTSPGPDGHVHRVEALTVRPGRLGGHVHELAARRCERAHDERGRHT